MRLGVQGRRGPWASVGCGQSIQIDCNVRFSRCPSFSQNKMRIDLDVYFYLLLMHRVSKVPHLSRAHLIQCRHQKQILISKTSDRARSEHRLDRRTDQLGPWLADSERPPLPPTINVDRCSPDHKRWDSPRIPPHHSLDNYPGTSWTTRRLQVPTPG
jgi:hypothetical protein